MDRKEERSTSLQISCTDKVQPVEISAEITLPDYRDEISRLLWVRPTVLPPTRFIGGGKADFSGPVHYDILYTGPDGRLYGAEVEEGYAFSVPVEQGAGELTAEVVPDAVISRVVGPRKLSVKCRLRADVRELEEWDPKPRVKGAEEDDRVEKLCEAVTCKRIVPVLPAQSELNDAAQIEPADGEWRLISADAALFLPDASAMQGSVRCRGEVLLSLLLCRESGEEAPQLITRRVPFEREIPAQGIVPDCSVCITGRVTDLRTTVDEGQILSDMTLLLWGEGRIEEDVVLCRDMFVPGCAGEYRFDEKKLQTGGFCGNRNFSVSGEKALAELGLGQDVRPVFSVADGEITERRAEGDQTVLLGEMHCHVLYGQDAEYAVADFSVPFRTAVEGNWDTVGVGVSVPSCRVSVVRDALRADGEVLLSLSAVSHAPVRVLTQAAFSVAEPQPRADLELCYPCTGETLWEVSRRYGISPEALADANGLSADAPGAADSLAGVRYLLVP